MHDPLLDAQRLIRQKHLSDGLPEVLIGFGFITYGTVSWIASMPQKTWLLRALGLTLILISVALGLGAMRLIQCIRRRFLLQRTGLVSYRQTPSRTRLIALITAAVALAVAIIWMLIHGLQPGRWLLFSTGPLIGGAQIALVRVPRFTAFGIFAITAGISLTLAPVSLELGIALFFWSNGLIVLTSGLIAVALSLHRPIEALPQ